MSIKCGNCKGRHNSVNEVRECGTVAPAREIVAHPVMGLKTTAKKNHLPAWAEKYALTHPQREQGPKVVAMSIDEAPSPTGRLTRSTPVMQSIPGTSKPRTGTVAIPDGIYAIHHDGEPKCYEISNGKAGTRWAGFIFLDRVSSDDRYSIRNRDEKARILDAIREDVEGSGRLAAQILRRCRGISEKGRPCRRQLTDTKNPYFEMGYGPECGSRV